MAYRLWCPRKKKIVVSRDVILDEDTSSHFSALTQSSSSPPSSSLPDYSILFPLESSASQSSVQIGTQSPGSSIGVSQTGGSSPRVSPGESSFSSPVGDSPVRNFDVIDTSSVGDSVSIPNERSVSHSSQNPLSNISPSSAFDDLNPVLRTKALADLYSDIVPVFSSSFAVATSQDSRSRVSTLPLEPHTYKQAVNSEHKEEWTKAIIEEIESLLKNETWTLSHYLLGEMLSRINGCSGLK